MAAKKKRGTTYAEHTGMLHMLTKRAYGRMIGAGMQVDYEDLYQEMCVAFVQAGRKFDPEKGFAFTTYFGQACWNRYINVVNKKMRDLPTINASSLATAADTEGSADVIGAMFASDDMGPEERIEAISEARERIAKMPPELRMVVRELLAPSNQTMREAASRESKPVVARSEVKIADVLKGRGLSQKKRSVINEQISSYTSNCIGRPHMPTQTTGTVAAKREKPASGPVKVYSREEIQSMFVNA